jgi:hypothetical protein
MKQVGRPRSTSGRFVSQTPSAELLQPSQEPGAAGGVPTVLHATAPAMPAALVAAPRVTRPLARFMKSALAGLMVACGDLDAAMEEAACRALGIEPRHWRLIAEPGLGAKIRILKALLAGRDFGEGFGNTGTQIWPWLESIEAAWSAIALRRLFMLDQSKLLAGDLPDHGGEPEDGVYSLQRLRQLETMASSLADTFRRAAIKFDSVHALL